MKRKTIGGEEVPFLTVEVRAEYEGRRLVVSTGEVDSAIMLARVVEELDGRYTTLCDHNGFAVRIPLRTEDPE